MLIDKIYKEIDPGNNLFELDENGRVLIDDMNMFKCNFQDGTTINWYFKEVRVYI